MDHLWTDPSSPRKETARSFDRQRSAPCPGMCAQRALPGLFERNLRLWPAAARRGSHFGFAFQGFRRGKIEHIIPVSKKFEVFSNSWAVMAIGSSLIIITCLASREESLKIIETLANKSYNWILRLACWQCLGDKQPPSHFDLRWFEKIASTTSKCLADRSWLRRTLFIFCSGRRFLECL